MQEFGEQNPLLCKQLGDAVAKLTEVQRHTTQQVQDRANRLKKVRLSFSSTCDVDSVSSQCCSHKQTKNTVHSVIFVILKRLSCSSFAEQAERQVEEYRGMKAFILGWTEKAEALVTGGIIWGSASQMQEQIRAHQVSTLQ